MKWIKIENNIELILKLFIDWTELPIRSNTKAEGILFAIIILRSADLCTNLLKASILGGAKNQGNYISFLSVIKVFYGASKILPIGLSTGNNTVKKTPQNKGWTLFQAIYHPFAHEWTMIIWLDLSLCFICIG